MDIYLIDGHAILYRAYYSYATKNLANSKGLPTNVPYGFMLVLNKILKDFKPDGLAVAFDVKGPTFRHEKFAEYKANRKPTPEDLLTQIPYAREIVEAHNIPVFEMKGFEADDVLGTLAKRIAAEGHRAIIVTSDKDACQLVGDHIALMDPGKDYTMIGPDEVKLKMGVKPSQVIDYLALVGDSSDNIPGVPSIGPKSAKALLSQYDNLETVLENAGKMKQPSKRKTLEENKDLAMISKDLATICCDVPIELSLDELRPKDPDVERLTKIFKELEFRNFLKQLPAVSASTDSDFSLIKSDKDFKKFAAKLKAKKAFAFDFETTSVDALRAIPVGLSFCFEDRKAVFILFDSHKSGASDIDSSDALNFLKPVFEDEKIEKYGQNIKYEMMVLEKAGVFLRGVAFDTMVASYLLNPSRQQHNLGELALEHLDEKLIDISELIGKGRSQITMDEADLDKLTQYGCQDSEIVWRLTNILKEKVRNAGVAELLESMEMPLIRVLCDMECTGIGLDESFLRDLSGKMEKTLTRLTSKIYKLAGHEFNIKSTQQLAVVLFEELKLPVVRKTKTGASTDMEVLSQLSELHELPDLVLAYRETAKLKSTYVDAMPGLINPDTGRIHSSFNQAVTATGRLSSSDPNLQNIPVRSDEGRQIRKAFIAGNKNVIVAADYSQIELRILAHLADEENLRKAFLDGEDIHAYTASLIFSQPQSKVSPEMRAHAKTVNFGVLYGMSPFGLAKSLKISQEAARDFIHSYFDRYPGVKKYLDGTVAYAKEFGFVETLFHRRRYIPDISSKEVRVRQFAERTAINAPVQGTASDLIKIAMINIWKELPQVSQDSRMLVQVHDELLFEVPKKDEVLVGQFVKEKMEQAIELSVPIEVTLKSGQNWCDLKKVSQ